MKYIASFNSNIIQQNQMQQTQLDIPNIYWSISLEVVILLLCAAILVGATFEDNSLYLVHSGKILEYERKCY